MEAVLFIGAPGAGKSTFFKQRFFLSHIRVSLDLLKTRHREQTFLTTCLSTQQRFVVDNTNPTRLDRVRYIAPAKAAGFQVVGYYFQSIVADCLQRNAGRAGAERIPDGAVISIARKIELPQRAEGFDALFYVRLTDGRFVVENWNEDGGDDLRRPGPADAGV
ncbi:MAG TPA: AAA family ATPase [Pirellulales bacterium]